MTDAARPDSVEWAEVQRVLLSGYPKQPWAHFLMLRVTDASLASRFLGGLLAHRLVKFGWGDRRASGPVGNVAFTREGFEALGMDEGTLAGFSPEFREGMTAPPRARKMRDVDESDPEVWAWGYGATQVHLVLMLYAASESELGSLVDAQRVACSEGGLTEVFGPSGDELGVTRPLADRREHFGFADGIVQPRFRDEPPGMRSRPVRDADLVETGELLLGYPNEANILPRSPTLSAAAKARTGFERVDGDFGKNGSYLVFRQLEQDVGGFWRSMACIGPGATVDDRVRLASKMVGRWPDGAALVTHPQSSAQRSRDPENFDYARDDPHGDRCPLGAHIRRSNPRASLAVDPELGLAKSKKHRILRRGRSYGEPFVEPMTPSALVHAAEAGTGRPGPRGLQFLCFNADLANQFEFVQQTWINGTVFQGLHGEVDPLVGDPSVTGGRFSVPSEPLRRIQCVRRFAIVKGGAYLFLPSRAALRYLTLLG
jgi:deferrochelatase/peroxidase EfeB